MAMIRLMKSAATLASLGAVLFLAACAGPENTQTSGDRLSSNPPVIIVEPFSNEHASYLVKRTGWELEGYKNELPPAFQDILVERLQKIAPTKKSWTKDTLPKNGWLIRGEFLKVYAGSGILRNSVGFGAGQSIFTCRVYVYDLSVSSTEYVYTFATGIDSGHNNKGATPGLVPAGGASAGVAAAMTSNPGTIAMTGGSAAFASAAYSEGSTRPFPNPTQAQEVSPVNDNQYTSQYQDMARTARTIRDTLISLSREEKPAAATASR